MLLVVVEIFADFFEDNAAVFDKSALVEVAERRKVKNVEITDKWEGAVESK